MPPESSEHEKEKIERLRRAMYSRSLSDKIKDRPRRPLDLNVPIVGDEFVRHEQTAPGSIVAPRGIGLARSALWWVLGVAIVFFVIAAGVFVYYFVFGGGSLAAAPGNIDISISGPPQIQSGQPTELQIVVGNRNKVTLELADLVITYPQGTRSPIDFATDLPSQRIPLGTVESGGERQGTVTAVFAGAEGAPVNVKVELEYHIPGSSAIFVASSNYNVVFATSPLSIAVDANTQTIAGQPVELAVTVASNASAPLSDVLLQAQYPFGFKFASASPSPSAAGFWKLGNFAPGQKQTITIQGTLSGEQGDQRVFRFTAGTRTSATSSAITNVLADNTVSMSISKPFLGLSVAVNGASGPNVVVSPANAVTVSIAWQNNLPTAITNAVIVARLSGVAIDGTTVHSTDGFYRSSDAVVLWDKTTTNGALANLAPGAHGVVSFSFQAPTSDALKSIVNPRIDISVNAAGNRISESGVPENLQAATDQKIALASDVGLTAQGLYYGNPFGSVGPMPPKAGTETTYAIVFTVTNTTSKIENASISAQLPPYVRWIGIYSPSSEHLTFNQLNGTMTWDLGEIAPNVGINGAPPRQAAIAIGMTPSTSQIGQQPILIQNVTLSGTDASTGAAITRDTAPDVTTNLTQVAKSPTAITPGTDPGFSAANATVVK